MSRSQPPQPLQSQPLQAQVWDPGARILIYSDANNNHHNNSINVNVSNNNNNSNIKNTKEKSYSLLSTRASPNKSQDSGFSDSGESESSSNTGDGGSKAAGHVTKVYFYSNNAESHYQSPTSLPVYSTVTKIQTGTGNSSRDSSHARTLAVADSLPPAPAAHNRANSKKELKNVVVVQGSGCRTVSSVSVDGSYHPAKMRIFHKAAKPDPVPRPQHTVTNISDQSASPASTSSPASSRSAGSASPPPSSSSAASTASPGARPRLNSIAELLEHFRQEDAAHTEDTRSSRALPVYSSATTSTSSCTSSSVSASSPCSSSEARAAVGPVDHWLGELPSLYESECSVMLQSKSLQGLHKLPGYKHQVYQDIRIIQDNAREVTKSFAELCRLLSSQTRKEKLVAAIKYLEFQVQRLINLNCVTKFRLNGGGSQQTDLQSLPGLRLGGAGGGAAEFGSLETESNAVIMREHHKILSYLHDLKFCAAHGGAGAGRKPGHSSLAEMVRSATKFGSCITVLVEEMLSSKVGTIVTQCLDPGLASRHPAHLEQVLVAVTSLGLEGNHLCRLMTKHGAVSMLVSLLSRDSCPVRAPTLRALATLCSVLEAIRQLEEVRGVEVIARLLGDTAISEAERAEAAGVLAQVTSPWIEDNDYVLGVTENAFSLVRDLTHMCAHTKCDETFLLGSAALANLSFLSPLILTAMSGQDTVAVLLHHLSRTVSPSIYIQDQVATVLANMAARLDTQECLVSANIGPVLLHLLAASPASEELPVLAATQRVQQKAAIAIGRLSAQHSVMAAVMSGAGLERLVELSVCKKARLDSDSTLVAVITAVRKISQSQNISHLLTNLGASELLDSCLLSSFKLFSTKHESFV